MISFKKESAKIPHPVMNPSLLDETIQQKISRAFKNGSEYSEPSIQVSGDPFTHCIAQKFITDEHEDKGVFLNSLQQDLMKLDFNEKSNDLYKFSQSYELMMTPQPSSEDHLIQSRKHLNHLCTLFRTTVLPWMRKITGVNLNDTIDMFSAQYKYTGFNIRVVLSAPGNDISNPDLNIRFRHLYHVLLCHDDELDDRRIAYILYLSDDWMVDDGGSLDLFSVDERGDPNEIVKSLIPASNSFVFFEVSPVSYHQVSEILSKTKTRLSLSGWFHGPTQPRPQKTPSPRTPAITFLPAQQSEKYKRLSQSIQHLSNHEEFWFKRGPANKRNYRSMKFDQDFELLESEASSSTNDTDDKKFRVSLKTMEAYNFVNDFIRLFCSEEMFLYMSNVTGLSFHPMAANFEESSGAVHSDDDDEVVPSKRTRLDERTDKGDDAAAAGLNSKCRYEIRCWSKGCYTLICDNDSDQGHFELDVNLQCGAEGWEQQYGGFTSYIAQCEDAELLTVVPSCNCLSLAYRDNEALRFVKHVNERSPKSFFDFSFIYAE